MFKERIERHQLRDYLQVYNHHNDRLLGCLGNISEEGLMLISSLPMLVGARFDLCLKSPRKDGQSIIEVNATCLWCHEDETPGCYDAGFELTEICTDYLELIDSLRHYFCFYPSMEASA